MNPDYSTLVGFTKEEIMHYFPMHIKAMSESEGISESDVMTEMEKMYNGYKFSCKSESKVYNPVSVIQCFTEKMFGEFWSIAAQGNLSELIKYPDLPLLFPQNSQIEVSRMPKNFDNPNLIKLLWEGGYFTIDSYSSGKFKLVVPNKEVLSALNSLAYELSFGQNESKIVEFLTEINIEEVISELSNVLFSTNSRYHFKNEREFEMALINLLKWSGVKASGQVPAGNGILDITFDVISRKNKKIGYIFELKVGEPASNAIAQIKKKRYYNEMRDYDSIVLIGLSLNKESKHIDNAKYIVFEVSTNSEIEKGEYDISFDNKDDQMSLKLELTKKV